MSEIIVVEDQPAKRLSRDVTIVLDIGQDGPKKVFKLLRLDGGDFAACVPYHPTNDGLATKVPVDYSHVGLSIIPESKTETYTAESEMKLSFHLSGYVHFSGKGVVSGWDHAKNEDKGLGLRAPEPVDISTGGPAFGVMVWGLEEYPGWVSKKGRSAVEFSRGDLYYRDKGDGERVGYFFECFLMKAREHADAVRTIDGRQVWRGEIPYVSMIDFRHDLRVVPLRSEAYFLAMMVSKVSIDFESAVGYQLAGPGCNDGTGQFYVLNAVCPRPYEPENATSLDYQPEE